jgi:hypothetical protein
VKKIILNYFEILWFLWILIRYRIQNFSISSVFQAKVLGSGQESTVFKIISKGNPYVVKLFYLNTRKGINKSHTAGLSNRLVGATEASLKKISRIRDEFNVELLIRIELLRSRSNTVIATYYPYEKLHKISRQDLIESPTMHVNLLRAFLLCQSILISKGNIAIADGSLGNFMKTKNSEFRYIDYGNMIIQVDDFRAQEENYLLMVLLDIYFIPIKIKVPPILNKEQYFSMYNQEISYVESTHNKLAAFSKLLRSSNRLDLFDSKFYARMVDALDFNI